MSESKSCPTICPEGGPSDGCELYCAWWAGEVPNDAGVKRTVCEVRVVVHGKVRVSCDREAVALVAGKGQRCDWHLRVRP